MNKSKLWTKNFLIDAITNVLIYLAYYLLMVTITVYAMDDLHASPSEAGLASGIFIIGTLLARILVGRSIERIGRKKMLYLGLISFLATTLLYFGIVNLELLIIIRFLHGATFGICSTATGTIVAGIIPDERRGEGISYYSMSATLASAVGPFLGMFLNQQGNFSMILILAVILIAISLGIVFFLKVPEVTLTQEQLDETKGFALNNFFETKAVPISIVSIFIGFGFSSILSFINVYSREINLVYAGSFFFIVYASSILISRPFTGRLFDQKGENFIMYPSFVLMAIGLLMIGRAHNGFVLLLSGVLIGFGYGTFVSSAQTIAIKSSPPHRMGMATSTFFSFIDGGVGIGPFILGFLIPVTGYRFLYISMAVVVFACIFLYYCLHGRKVVARKEFSGGSLRTQV